MTKYIATCTTPRISSRFLKKVTVPSGGLVAGQVVYLEELDPSILGNTEVYVAQTPTTDNLSSINLGIVVNGGFETLADGRRPSGQPDYTEYAYQEGDVADVVMVDSHLFFEINGNCIDPTTRGNLAVGKLLVPQNNSKQLTVADQRPKTTANALNILAIKSFRVGNSFETVYVCVPQNEFIDSGNYIYSFNLPNQVGGAIINHSAGTIDVAVAGGLTGLKATFTTSHDATVFISSTPQTSGVTVNSFDTPITYKVVSESGEEKEYVVTASLAKYNLSIATDHATVVVSDGVNTYENGEKVEWNSVLTITATADSGYAMDTLTVNGESFISGSTHTVESDIAIIATAEEQEQGAEFQINDTVCDIFFNTDIETTQLDNLLNSLTYSDGIANLLAECDELGEEGIIMAVSMEGIKMLAINNGTDTPIVIYSTQDGMSENVEYTPLVGVCYTASIINNGSLWNGTIFSPKPFVEATATAIANVSLEANAENEYQAWEHLNEELVLTDGQVGKIIGTLNNQNIELYFKASDSHEFEGLENIMCLARMFGDVESLGMDFMLAIIPNVNESLEPSTGTLVYLSKGSDEDSTNLSLQITSLELYY